MLPLKMDFASPNPKTWLRAGTRQWLRFVWTYPARAPGVTYRPCSQVKKKDRMKTFMGRLSAYQRKIF